MKRASGDRRLGASIELRIIILSIKLGLRGPGSSPTSPLGLPSCTDQYSQQRRPLNSSMSEGSAQPSLGVHAVDDRDKDASDVSSEQPTHDASNASSELPANVTGTAPTSAANDASPSLPGNVNEEEDFGDGGDDGDEGDDDDSDEGDEGDDDRANVQAFVKARRKSKTKAERDAARGKKAGNQGRFHGEQLEHLEKYREAYGNVKKGIRGKNAELSEFWTLVLGAFWSKFKWREVRKGMAKEDQLLKRKVVIERTNEVSRYII